MLRDKLPLPGLQKDVPLRYDGNLVISGGHLARSEDNLEGEQSEENDNEVTPLSPCGTASLDRAGRRVPEAAVRVTSWCSHRLKSLEALARRRKAKVKRSKAQGESKVYAGFMRKLLTACA